MQINNFFDFATDESTQDAFLAWCANWANYDNGLAKLGRDFVRLVSDIEDVRWVRVYQQYKKIDVLLIVNGSTAVIIEDKVYSSEHDDQIRKYKAALEKTTARGVISIYGEEYAVSEIKTVYLKTGNFYPDDLETQSHTDIVNKTIKRKDLAELLFPYIHQSEIVRGFYDRLMHIGEWYRRYEGYYRSGDFNRAFSESYGQYFCFLELFGEREMLGGIPGKVRISCKSSSGSPYTWAWLWGRDDLCWLGYRLSKFSWGYAVSLRLYFECGEELRQDKYRLYSGAKELFAGLCDGHGYKDWVFCSRNREEQRENEIARLYINAETFPLLPELYPLARELFSLAVSGNLPFISRKAGAGL